MSDAAPYFAEIVPEGSKPEAHWITAKDGVRLRVGVWHAHAKTSKGTLLLFPGRTEYIEKYAPVARDMDGHGISTIAIDWRGQGISDRLIPDPLPGHVETFSDYQMDVAAMLDLATALNLPHPWFMLGHSMGGAIALRAVMEGAPVNAVAFSGPMWGISASPVLRPVMWTLSTLSRFVGLSHRYPPTTSGPRPYPLAEEFDKNGLTRDAAMYQLMRDQFTARPELKVGAPTLNWLYEALCETRKLSGRASPDLPCLTIMGSEEAIVDQARVKDRMERWPASKLHLEPGGRHELLMEDTATRQRLTAMIAQHFLSAR
ncbi:MAG: alpha/beta hydrolase [Pseudomonadota bacterium]